MESLLPIIIQVISGAVGGNIAGAAVKSINQGTIINSIVGILGGGLGGQILSAVLGGGMETGGGAMDIGSIISSVAGGGVGGGIGLAIISMIRKAVSK